MGSDKIDISIFFPAYNDEGTIASMVVKSLLVAEKHPRIGGYEIIVVNDGSPDNLKQIAGFFEKMLPDKVRVVTHEQNRGYGGALRTGFAEARYDYIFYTDGDGQYDVFELEKLIEEIDGSDLVNGYKIKRHDPWYRIVIGELYNRTVKLWFGIKLKDVDCDFRIVKKSVFDKFALTQDSGVICVELVKKIEMTGGRVSEVPVRHMFRALGHSQFFNFKRLFRVFFALLKLWYRLVIKKDTGKC